MPEKMSQSQVNNRTRFMRAMMSILTNLKRKTENTIVGLMVGFIATFVIGIVALLVCEIVYLRQAMDAATVTVLDICIICGMYFAYSKIRHEYIKTKIRYRDLMVGLSEGIQFTQEMEDDFLQGLPIQIRFGYSSITVIDTRAHERQ